MCSPSASSGVVNGDSQGSQSPASSRHSKLEPGSSEENSKVGVGSGVTPEGPESMVVCGAVASTVIEREAGVASTLPTESVERTSKLCSPSASSGVVNGDSQGSQSPASSRHSKLEPGSSEENSKVGVGSGVTPEGPESMVVCGAVASTVIEREAGVASTLPTESVARTSKLCSPSVSSRSS